LIYLLIKFVARAKSHQNVYLIHW